MEASEALSLLQGRRTRYGGEDEFREELEKSDMFSSGWGESRMRKNREGRSQKSVSFLLPKSFVNKNFLRKQEP